jgi:hypothetical protein
MNAEFMNAQRKAQKTLSALVETMADLAQMSAQNIGDEQKRDTQTALGWVERADIVARLAESIPTREEHAGRFPYRLERRTA